MKTLQTLSRVTACAVLFSLVALWTEPVSAQVYYYQPTVQPVYPLPGPNYVVYSPSFLAWRSSGYYAGNWGPYYYDPPALYPVLSANMISPTVTYATPPVVWYYGR